VSSGVKSPEMVLRVENLWKWFDEKPVLKGVSFEVRRGEVKVIMGPSGAGKSTLLKCIDMLIEPDEGEIWLEGVELTNLGKELNQYRRKIGFVFQEFNLFSHLTSLDNVMIGLRKVRKFPKNRALEVAEKALKSVHIDRDLWHKYPAQLSGGQKQRVAIARALAMEPTIMLYDEPTSALDPQLTGEVLEVIKELAEKGMTSIIVTHELGFALEVADELMIMRDGKIVERGAPRDVVYSPEFGSTKIFFEKVLRFGGMST